MTTTPPVVSWRCFPWNPAAAPGESFSPPSLQSGQTTGRFDLGDRPPVRYLAGSDAHAVAEVLQGFRGATLTRAHLKRHGWPLELGRRPAELAHHDRGITQDIARQAHDAGNTGLKWWSALSGAWTSTVLFADRVSVDELTISEPVPITLKSAGVVEAARRLGIGLT